MMSTNKNDFAPDSWINTEYTMCDRIGEGGFGVVRRAVHLATGETVAIKIMNKARLGKDLQHIYQEISTLKNLMHQNICRLYQVVETKRDIFLILEYCEQGEMFDYIVTKNKLSEPEARYFFRQLVQAISYTHRQGYAHRDLKPENLLLKGDLRLLKVIDFGLSSRTGKQLDTYCGSLCYAAPEIIMNRPYSGPAADIWSMGVLLYILVTGSAPFNSDDQRKVTHNITHGIYKVPEKLSADCQGLIKCMLTVDVQRRIKMDEIMTHRWVQEGFVSQLKASTIYQKDLFDDSVLREMAVRQRCAPDDLREELKKWNFDYNTATYLALLQRKENNLSIMMPDYNMRKPVANSPTFHLSLEKDLNKDVRTNHDAKAMLDRNAYDSMRSSLNTPRGRGDKENAAPMFAKPADPRFNGSGNQSISPFTTPKRDASPVLGGYRPSRRTGSLSRSSRPYTEKPAATPVVPNPMMQRYRQQEPKQSPVVLPKSSLSNEDKPQKSAVSVTPLTSTALERKSRSSDRSSRRPRIVASLERGSQRMFEFLTPRRLRRDPSQVKVCKNYVNVSVTSSNSPDAVRDKLISALEELGFLASNEGWKVHGVHKQNKASVELEVVWVEHFSKIGVKRKRICGDSFLYKSVCEAVLKMSGL